MVYHDIGFNAPRKRGLGQSLRLDNGEPDVIEIVLDGPMPLGETRRFTFDTGQRSNVVEFTLATPPVIPAASEWGLLVMALFVLTTGTLVLRRGRGPGQKRGDY